ncbi:MAG: nucleotidyltransferase family protein, partial [Acidimicrobiia bacterium]
VWDDQLAPRLSLDDLDGGAQDLDPRLHRRLVDLDARVPDLERMRGVRRRTLVRNEQRLRPAGDGLAVLRAAGIEGVLVGGGGVALALGHLDLRPVHDVDVLVAPGDVAPAARVLRQAGWRAGPRWLDGALLDVGGAAFAPPDHATGLNLRWSAAPPYDDAVAAGRPVLLGTAALAVACPADLLLHTLLDGDRAAMPRSPRWASDGLAVLEAAADGGSPVDWDRVVGAALRRGRARALLDGLLLLEALVPVDLPAEAVRALGGDRQPGWIRRLDPDPAARPGLVTAIARRAAADGPLGAARSLPALVRAGWGSRRRGGPVR